MGKMRIEPRSSEKKEWRKPCIHSLEVPGWTAIGDSTAADEDEIDPSVTQHYHPSP